MGRKKKQSLPDEPHVNLRDALLVEPDTDMMEEPLHPLNDPFDPSEISIEAKPLPIETLLRRLDQGSINLSPDFQRNEVWTIEKRSRLIESIMLKIPLPMFYVSANAMSEMQVVDGLQRMSTIRDFVLGEEYLAGDRKALGKGFKLKKLEFWVEYEGKQFADLPVFLRNRILETQIHVTVINPTTPEVVRRNVFKRINTGGMALSGQEIRNALYNGPSTQLIRRLAATEAFQQAAIGVKTQRMEDHEMILRFMAFLARPYESYNMARSLDTFLSDTLVIFNGHPAYETHEFKRAAEAQTIKPEDIQKDKVENAEGIFMAGVSRAAQLFGEHCFRKSYPGRRRSPLNKSLFEMWTLGLGQLSEHQFQGILDRQAAFMDDYKALVDSDEFQFEITRDSMKRKVVSIRFGKIDALIAKYSY